MFHRQPRRIAHQVSHKYKRPKVRISFIIQCKQGSFFSTVEGKEVLVG